MKTQIFLISLFFSYLAAVSAQEKVLVFTKTNGFRHAGAIDAGKQMITDLGNTNGLWDTDFTENPDDFTTNTLSNYNAVIWLNTSGNNLLNADQRQAFEDFIAGGGGFLGIHAATDTYRDRSWFFYNELVGAIIQTNPNHTRNNFNADMEIVSGHPTVNFLGNVGDTWNKSEEYYYWKNNGGQLFAGNINLLMVEATGSNDYDEARPISWYKEYGGGRSFYTALGHNASDYIDNTNFIKHIEEGIKYVIGNTLSIGDQKENIAVKILQNPVQEVLAFTIEETHLPKELYIYTISGARVLSTEVTTANTAIAVSYLPKGLYIAKLISDTQEGFFKFIKE